jgi:hypothetical protein
MPEDPSILRKIAEAATRVAEIATDYERESASLATVDPFTSGGYDFDAGCLRSLLDQLQEKDATIERLREALQRIEREAHADRLIAAVRVQSENPTASARLMAQIARLRFANLAQEITRASLEQADGR